MLDPILPGAHSRAHGESVSTLPRSVVADRAEDLPPSSADTWFRTADGRRYAWEIALVIVMKLALLLLLWFAFIKPWGHPATPVASAVQQIYLPDGPANRHD
jgi:hypothetical protein